MALLHIAEPGLSAAPHQHKWAVGIDLGTTNSLVAVVRSASAETLADEQGRHLLPSVVHYQRDGVRVGYEARQEAALDPRNTLSSIKRWMGKAAGDVSLDRGQTDRPHRHAGASTTAHGIGAPRAASNKRYQSSRSSFTATLSAQARSRSLRLVPSTGMIPAG